MRPAAPSGLFDGLNQLCTVEGEGQVIVRAALQRLDRRARAARVGYHQDG